MSKRPSIEQAKAQYVHRFTMEHVPQWAKRPMNDGRYYAPQFRTDAEWYANTRFPGEPGHLGGKNECTTLNQTFPLGQWLTKAYERGDLNRFAACPGSYKRPIDGHCCACGRAFAPGALAGAALTVPLHSPDQKVPS